MSSSQRPPSNHTSINAAAEPPGYSPQLSQRQLHSTHLQHQTQQQHQQQDAHRRQTSIDPSAPPLSPSASPRRSNSIPSPPPDYSHLSVDQLQQLLERRAIPTSLQEMSRFHLVNRLLEGGELSLNRGKSVDVRDIYGKWLNATVLHCYLQPHGNEHDESLPQPQHSHPDAVPHNAQEILYPPMPSQFPQLWVRVHFEGWDHKWNETISPHQQPMRFAKSGLFTSAQSSSSAQHHHAPSWFQVGARVCYYFQAKQVNRQKIQQHQQNMTSSSSSNSLSSLASSPQKQNDSATTAAAADTSNTSLSSTSSSSSNRYESRWLLATIKKIEGLQAQIDAVQLSGRIVTRWCHVESDEMVSLQQAIDEQLALDMQRQQQLEQQARQRAEQQQRQLQLQQQQQLQRQQIQQQLQHQQMRSSAAAVPPPRQGSYVNPFLSSAAAQQPPPPMYPQQSQQHSSHHSHHRLQQPQQQTSQQQRSAGLYPSILAPSPFSNQQHQQQPVQRVSSYQPTSSGSSLATSTQFVGRSSSANQLTSSHLHSHLQLQQPHSQHQALPQAPPKQQQQPEWWQGQMLEVFDKNGVWCVAEVTQFDAVPPPQQQSILVRYTDKPPQFDEWLDVRSNARRIRALGSAMPETADQRHKRESDHAFRMHLISVHPDFRIVESSGDGNCLFRSVSHQIYGTQERHAEVRQRCYDYMLANRDFFAVYVSEPFDAYVARQRRDSQWGDHIEIVAMRELYNKRVHVYDADHCEQPLDLGTLVRAEAESSRLASVLAAIPVLRLSYHGSSHYNSVVCDSDPLPLGDGRDAKINLRQLRLESEAAAAQKHAARQQQQASASTRAAISPPGQFAQMRIQS